MVRPMSIGDPNDHVVYLIVFRRPNAKPHLPTGIHHIAKIMPHVLARYGLSLGQEPESVLPAKATEATELFDVAISSLKSAPAG
jgi:hypothetical protein